MKHKSKSSLLDKIIIVDLEATCWRGHPPEGQENEIIEIGVCLLDIHSGDISEIQGILVKPSRSTVSAFCTELTTLTQAQVDEGISFQEACKLLRSHYKSRQRVWASYGDYDRRQVQKQCESREVPYPFGRRHINVKTLCAIRNKWPHEIGMDKALKHLEIPLHGTHHRGVDDAFNIAHILRTLI